MEGQDFETRIDRVREDELFADCVAVVSKV